MPTPGVSSTLPSEEEESATGVKWNRGSSPYWCRRQYCYPSYYIRACAIKHIQDDCYYTSTAKRFSVVNGGYKYLVLFVPTTALLLLVVVDLEIYGGVGVSFFRPIDA